MAKKRPITPKKLLVRVLIVLGVLVAFILFLFLYEGSTKPILSVADKFQPDPSWELVGESVEPPRFVCLNSVRCPSVSRVWNTGELVGKDEFKQILASSGLNFPIDGDCKRKTGVYGSVTLCSASGMVSEMKVTVAVGTNDYAEEKNRINLSVH